MARARDSASRSSDEYHSYVLRVRALAAGPRPAAKPALSVRVEYVNQRKAMHFNELSGALNFIAESVDRNLLHPDQ
jgi:hypothetical protein